MVQEIVWSLESKKNLSDIKKHIEAGSLFYAERVVRQIYERTKVLHNHPEFGMPVLQYQEVTLQRLLFQSYRIIYFIKDEKAFIVTVFHQSRQFTDSLQTHSLFQ